MNLPDYSDQMKPCFKCPTISGMVVISGTCVVELSSKERTFLPCWVLDIRSKYYFFAEPFMLQTE